MRAVDSVLAYTAYVRLAGHRARQVALTFDDGPSEYTPAILRISGAPTPRRHFS